MRKIKTIIYLIYLLSITLSAQVDKLVPGELSDYAMFGYDVAISSPWAVVSATGQSNDGSINAGKVSVFKFVENNWELHSILTPSNSNNLGLFGTSVAIDGGKIAIGAPGDKEKGPFYGAVYLYELIDDSWNQSAKLMPSKGVIMQYFGRSVDIAGSRIVAGAPSGNGMIEKSGAVYLFEKKGDNWVESATLIASDPGTNDSFGFDVAIGEDGSVIVGAPGSTSNIKKSGAVYVFENNNGNYDKSIKLYDEMGTTGDRFGYSVSMNNNRVAVGSHVSSYNKIFPGAVYVYSKTGEGWELEDKINNDGGNNDFFGYDVTIYADYLLVGAPTTNSESVNNIGSATLYGFNGSGWEEENDFQLTGQSQNDYFASSVAMDSTYLLIGSRLFGEEDQGAAYIRQYNNLTGVDELIPEVFHMAQNYPNPFNPSTTIEYGLPVHSKVKLVIFNVLGQKIESLVNNEQAAGSHRLTWNAGLYSSGVYFIRIDAEPLENKFDNFSSIKKMLLIK